MIVPIKVQEYDSCLGFERSCFQLPDKPPFVTSPKKVQGMRERSQTVQVEKRKQGGKMVKLKGFINFSIKN